MANKIRTIEDLFGHYGEPVSGDPAVDQERLSRRVYRDTDCGAWAVVIPPGKREVGTRREVWTAYITPSIVGPRVGRVRRKGCAGIPANKAPDYVRGYLLLDEHNSIPLTYEQVGALATDDNTDILRVTDTGKGMIKVVFCVQAPITKTHRGGLILGSIVEGSDVEIKMELFFPFTKGTLKGAIQSIEEEADFYWWLDNPDPDDPDHPGDQ